MTVAAAQSGVRLQKYLSRAGVASRRGGEQLIAEGRVSVDGEVVMELGVRVDPDVQVVRVDGVRVQARPKRWLAVYKPAGYLTTRRDERGRRTVYSLLPEGSDELFYVGRLDLMTEGLLIFSNDGETAHRLLHPKYGIRRRYRVEVEGAVDRAVSDRLARGVRLEDGIARAEDVEVTPVRGRGRRRSLVRLTLREGRKREVRRLMEAVGLDVTRLVRVSFGPIELGDLALGQSRELSAAEVSALKAAVARSEIDGDT
ncbi:MAG: pseudouridine synthase [Gemmatimonadales bacterium]